VPIVAQEQKPCLKVKELLFHPRPRSLLSPIYPNIALVFYARLLRLGIKKTPKHLITETVYVLFFNCKPMRTDHGVFTWLHNVVLRVAQGRGNLGGRVGNQLWHWVGSQCILPSAHRTKILDIQIIWTDFWTSGQTESRQVVNISVYLHVFVSLLGR